MRIVSQSYRLEDVSLTSPSRAVHTEMTRMRMVSAHISETVKDYLLSKRAAGWTS